MKTVITLAAIAAGYIVAGACIVVGIPPAPAPHGVVRIALGIAVEPIPLPDAPEMPQAVEHPTTGMFCLARPFLAEVTHLCREEGGSIDL